MLLIRACFRCWSYLLYFRVVHGFKSPIVVTLSLCKCGLVYFFRWFSLGYPRHLCPWVPKINDGLFLGLY
jgi:hypothetical protein